jgi:hypothetical protein
MVCSGNIDSFMISRIGFTRLENRQTQNSPCHRESDHTDVLLNQTSDFGCFSNSKRLNRDSNSGSVVCMCVVSRTLVVKNWTLRMQISENGCKLKEASVEM